METFLRPPTPGFQSLSQAGIQLGEDPLPQPQAMRRAVGRIREKAYHSAWPPLPTLENEVRPLSRIGFSSRTRGAKQVQVRPRGLEPRRNPAPSILDEQREEPLAPLPPIQFTCPSCRTFLTISDPTAYDGEAGPCPICTSVIMPPRVVVSPFSVLQSPE